MVSVMSFIVYCGVSGEVMGSGIVQERELSF